MGQYHNEAELRRVLDSTDITEVVGAYVALQPRGRELLGVCPFHDDHRPSMYVSPAKQIFKCFSCGAGGDAIKFVMLREQMSFPEALSLLAERAGIELTRSPGRQAGQGPDRGQLEQVNRWAARWFRDQLEDEQEGLRARQYIKERGIDEQVARRFGLGWAPAAWDRLEHAAQKTAVDEGVLMKLGLLVQREGSSGRYDRFRERLMFPVLDALGRVIAFGGRTLGEDPAKYMNSPESVLFDKSRALYGIHAAKDAIVKERAAVVVEGYTDCLMAHQHGITNVVATLGTALTPQHARSLRRYADRVVLVFDSDAAGQKAAERAIEVFFGAGLEVRLATVPGEKDPCDFLRSQGAAAFREVLAGAQDALEYKWALVRDRLDREETIGGRQRATEEFVGFVARACAMGQLDEISEGMVLGRVAQMVGVPVEQLYRRVRQHRQRGRGPQTPPAVRPEQMVGDALVNAQREVLEILLNRPELLAQVHDTIKGPEEFADGLHRQVAELIWRAAQSPGPLTLGQMLAGCTDPQTCAAVTDLAMRGEQRGNYEDTLRAALACVLRRRQEQQRQVLAQQVGRADQEYGLDTQTALLMDMNARLQAAKVPRKKAGESAGATGTRPQAQE